MMVDGKRFPMRDSVFGAGGGTATTTKKKKIKRLDDDDETNQEDTRLGLGDDDANDDDANDDDANDDDANDDDANDDDANDDDANDDTAPRAKTIRFHESIVTRVIEVPKFPEMKEDLFYSKADFVRFQGEEQQRYDSIMMKQIQKLVEEKMKDQIAAARARGATDEDIEAMMPQTPAEIFEILGGVAPPGMNVITATTSSSLGPGGADGDGDGDGDGDSDGEGVVVPPTAMQPNASSSSSSPAQPSTPITPVGPSRPVLSSPPISPTIILSPSGKSSSPGSIDSPILVVPSGIRTSPVTIYSAPAITSPTRKSGGLSSPQTQRKKHGGQWTSPLKSNPGPEKQSQLNQKRVVAALPPVPSLLSDVQDVRKEKRSPKSSTKSKTRGKEVQSAGPAATTKNKTVKQSEKNFADSDSEVSVSIGDLDDDDELDEDPVTTSHKEDEKSVSEVDEENSWNENDDDTSYSLSLDGKQEAQADDDDEKASTGSTSVEYEVTRSASFTDSVNFYEMLGLEGSIPDLEQEIMVPSSNCGEDNDNSSRGSLSVNSLEQSDQVVILCMDEMTSMESKESGSFINAFGEWAAQVDSESSMDESILNLLDTLRDVEEDPQQEMDKNQDNMVAGRKGKAKKDQQENSKRKKKDRLHVGKNPTERERRLLRIATSNDQVNTDNLGKAVSTDTSSDSKAGKGLLSLSEMYRQNLAGYDSEDSDDAEVDSKRLASVTYSNRKVRYLKSSTCEASTDIPGSDGEHAKPLNSSDTKLAPTGSKTSDSVDKSDPVVQSLDQNDKITGKMMASKEKESDTNSSANTPKAEEEHPYDKLLTEKPSPKPEMDTCISHPSVTDTNTTIKSSSKATILSNQSNQQNSFESNNNGPVNSPKSSKGPIRKREASLTTTKTNSSKKPHESDGMSPPGLPLSPKSGKNTIMKQQVAMPSPTRDSADNSSKSSDSRDAKKRKSKPPLYKDEKKSSSSSLKRSPDSLGKQGKSSTLAKSDILRAVASDLNLSRSSSVHELSSKETKKRDQELSSSSYHSSSSSSNGLKNANFSKNELLRHKSRNNNARNQIDDDDDDDDDDEFCWGGHDSFSGDDNTHPVEGKIRSGTSNKKRNVKIEKSRNDQLPPVHPFLTNKKSSERTSKKRSTNSLSSSWHQKPHRSFDDALEVGSIERSHDDTSESTSSETLGTGRLLGMGS